MQVSIIPAASVDPAYLNIGRLALQFAAELSRVVAEQLQPSATRQAERGGGGGLKN